MTNKHDDTPRVLSLIESRTVLSRLRVASEQETLHLSPLWMKIGQSHAWARLLNNNRNTNYVYAPRHGGDDFTLLRFNPDDSHLRNLVTRHDTPELHAMLCSLWEASRLRDGDALRCLRLAIVNYPQLKGTSHEC